MDILVIDDMRTFSGFDATYARTLAEGLRLIQAQPWDIVYLDHDLGYLGDEHEGTHWTGNKQTIRPLVLHVAQLASDGNPLPVKLFHVCTDNPPGRDWIIGTLERFYPVSYNQPSHTIEW